MKPIDQTVFSVPGGNCFSACVASLLETPLDDVPYFMGTFDEGDGVWWERFLAWLKPRGFTALMLSITGGTDGWQPPEALCILGGRSPRDLLEGDERRAALPGLPDGEPLLHVVVGRGREMVHDPHPSRAGLLDVRDVCYLIPLDPWRVA